LTNPLKLRRTRSRGQSLVEFGIILPILLMLIGGIVQYGAIFATKHSLIQVGRDVGRWAATQATDSAGVPLTDCSNIATGTPPQPVTQADLVAQQSHLMGYGSTGKWDTTNFYPEASLPPSPPNTEGVEVVWEGTPCPPADSTTTAWVTVRLTHRAPVLLPGFPWLPGLGTCDGSGCYLVVSTTARFRMEPPATS
jgi:Flp pilus assembly protein TadG